MNRETELPYMAIEERFVNVARVQRIEAYLVPAAEIRSFMPEGKKQFLLSSIPANVAIEFPETLAAWRDLVMQMAIDGHRAAVGQDKTHISYTAVKLRAKGSN